MPAPAAGPDPARHGPPACSACGSTQMTRLPMALTDGTDVVFLSCNRCERREWLAPTADGDWVGLPIETVLQRSTKPEVKPIKPKAAPRPRAGVRPRTDPERGR